MFMEFINAVADRGWPKIVLLSPFEYFELSSKLDPKYVFPDHITIMGVTACPKFPDSRPESADLSEVKFT